MRGWRSAAAIAAAGIVVGCGGGGSNLVLITMDTTRSDHLGCYGATGGNSPHLDALARQGVRFDHVVAQAAVTPVSHASILTGWNPNRHGLRALHGFVDLRMRPSARTLAQILGERGYATAAVVSAFPASSRFGLDRGFDHFDEAFLDGGGPVGDDGIVRTGAAQRRADATTDAAIAWLQSHRGGPFFLWVHYFDPHDPVVLPPAAILNHCGAVPGAAAADLIALYDCEIYYMDAQIGRLLRHLDRRGGGDLIAVTADHGEGLGDHDWWSHGVLYDEQVRLPWILRHPDLPAGATVPTRVRSIDIAPTLLAILGIDAGGERFDGASALGEIGAAAPGPDRTAYSESRNLVSYAVPHAPGRFDRKDDELYSLLDGDWKLIHHRRRPQQSELYDLATDPGETVNRFAERTDRAGELLDRLRALDGVFADGLATPPPDDLEERMRSLGYVEGGDE